MKFLALSLFFAVLATSTVVHAKSQRYAVLLATTKSWVYYRHQSNVMKAYQTMIANGFKKENIITMVYDDIAHNPRNPEPGVVRNHPYGPNLVPGFKKDYTGNKVNAETFLAVLRGDSSKAGGPVLKSGPKDKVFIYITGLGAHEAISFPFGSSLSAATLAAAVQKVKAKKVFLSLDVSYGSTLAAGRYSNNGHIFVSSATHATELPYAAFCYADKRLCYASLYGAAWAMHSDRLRQLKYGRRETLFDQYGHVRTLCVYTHVTMHGDLSLGKTKLKEFLDYKLEKKPKNMNLISQLGESMLNELEEKLEENPDDEELLQKFDTLSKLYDGVPQKGDHISSADLVGNVESLKPMHELDIVPAFHAEDVEGDIHEKREMIKDTIKTILNHLDVDSNINLPENVLSEMASGNYEKAIEAFSTHCFNVNENPHVLQHLGKLARVNELGIPLEKQIEAMKDICTDAHRQMKSIH